MIHIKLVIIILIFVILFIIYLLRKILVAALTDPQLSQLFLLVVVVIGSGTWIYHRVEGWSWLDSLYFTFITLTTVGYGDFSPQTDTGKIFTMIYILFGLGIIAAFITLVAERSQAWLTRQKSDRRKGKNS